jgi:hypothetical protein
VRRVASVLGYEYEVRDALSGHTHQEVGCIDRLSSPQGSDRPDGGDLIHHFRLLRIEMILTQSLRLLGWGERGK